MNIKPIKMEYYLEVAGHKLNAICIHRDQIRDLRFLIDDVEIFRKREKDGDLLSDDDIICDVVVDYYNNKSGAYADLFKNHRDRVKLVAKAVEVAVNYCEIDINARVTIEKERYIVKMSTNDEQDKLVGTFAASSFSDVLEKLRLFSGGLSGFAQELTAHLNEIANDEVERRIRWQE